MLILVTYDVNTSSAEGRKRLNKVAKCCESHGQRVQNSVFECILDYTQFLKLQDKLEKIIDENVDSLRYYNLGNKYEGKTKHVGAKPSLNVEDVLIL